MRLHNIILEMDSVQMSVYIRGDFVQGDFYMSWGLFPLTG